MSDRIRVLDAARGFAVLGLVFARFPSSGGSHYVHADPTLLGFDTLSALLWGFQSIYVDGVMRGTFAVLFGASMALMLAGDGVGIERVKAFVIRAFGLIALGVVHASVFGWSSDILSIYAVAGLGALCVIWLPVRLVFALGVAGLGLVVAYAGWRDISTLPPTEAELLATQAAVSAGYLSQLGASLNGFIDMVTTVHVLPQVMEAGGYMLIGYGLMQIRALDMSFRTLARAGLGLFAVGSVLGGAAIALNVMAGFGFHEGAHPLMRAAKPFLVLALLSGFTLALRQSVLAAISRAVFEPVGRLALTGYMGGSLIMLLLFTGAGLSLYGVFDRVELFGLAFVVSAVLVLLAKVWLAVFGQGPLERLLRGFVQLVMKIPTPPGRRSSQLPAE